MLQHLAVTDRDKRLQWFSLKGRFFCEKCLTFGSRASPGKYARTARIPIHLACLATGFPVENACMHLDDLVAVGEKEEVEAFHAEYTGLCKDLGISLQEPDGEKAFGPQRSGVVLGIFFDLEKWEWRLEEDKFKVYWHGIEDLLAKEHPTVGEVKQVTGRIIYVAPMMVEGRFYLSEILKLANADPDLRAAVEVGAGARLQLRWWQVALRVMKRGRRIPRSLGWRRAGMLAMVCDSDASGGGCYSDDWRGVGAVLGRAWARLQWPRLIRSEAECEVCGCMWKRKMSFLELLGWSLTICCFPDIVSNSEVTTRIDNAGTVVLWERGYDLRCAIVSCLLQQTQVVAMGLNTVSTVQKVTRCSERGPVLADLLSKGKLQEFGDMHPPGEGRELVQRRVPGPLAEWVKKPVVDDNLGREILLWMQEHGTAPAVLVSRELSGQATEMSVVEVFDLDE